MSAGRLPEGYTLDTNVYISALRNGSRLATLKRFLLRAGPRVRLHAVVAMELRCGARTEAQAGAVEALIEPYSERERVLVPSLEAFVQAGRVLAELATRERMALRDEGPALTADALIACACREERVTLITDNLRHFAAIQRHLRGFRFLDASAALDVSVR